MQLHAKSTKLRLKNSQITWEDVYQVIHIGKSASMPKSMLDRNKKKKLDVDTL